MQKSMSWRFHFALRSKSRTCCEPSSELWKGHRGWHSDVWYPIVSCSLCLDQLWIFCDYLLCKLKLRWWWMRATVECESKENKNTVRNYTRLDISGSIKFFYMLHGLASHVHLSSSFLFFVEVVSPCIPCGPLNRRRLPASKIKVVYYPVWPIFF